LAPSAAANLKWLREILDGTEDAQPLVENGLCAPHSSDSLGKLLEVHSHREVFFTRAADHDRAYAGVSSDALDFRFQRIHEIETHTISRGVIDDESLDRTLALDKQWTLIGCGLRRHIFSLNNRVDAPLETDSHMP